jgi:hypothetical protein
MGHPPEDDGWRTLRGCPSVHEALREAGEIDDPAKPGIAETLRWVAESDWVYRIDFSHPGEADAWSLQFAGIDTLADVYLNDRLVAKHRNLYLACHVEVHDVLQDTNVLLVHFHSPWAWIDRHPPAEGFDPTRVKPWRRLRKPNEDFNNFNGAQPYFTPIGFYDEVQLRGTDAAAFELIDLRSGVDPDHRRGWLQLELPVRIATQTGLTADDVEVAVRLIDPDGRTAHEQVLHPRGCVAAYRVMLDDVQLWWPRGYGEAALYRVEATLTIDGRIRDRVHRYFGFRHLRMDGTMRCEVNGVTIRYWGTNLTPLQNLSHRWDPQRWETLLGHVLRANHNTLRVWGPGAPYNEQVYDDADRLGLLLWDEFYHTWGGYPADPDYRRQCIAEAEAHVRRRKHHPSIMLWCGGNELAMGAEIENPGEPISGRELYEYDYRAVCGRLDPDRYYHPNSPLGGDFPNDPRVLDSHSYNHIWFIPGDDYPACFTENTRIGTPGPKTLRRVLGEDAWPANGFDGQLRRPDDSPIPDAWMALTLGEDFVRPRLGPIEAFYDTGDSLEGLTDRFGAAHGEWVRRCVERYRRGRPAHDPQGPRRVMGHYLWKLNNTWPMIYSNVVDYFNEPTAAYYALARAYAPQLLSFDFADLALVWGVNDTPRRMTGTLRVEQRKLEDGRVVASFEQGVDLPAGASAVICDLNPLGMFERNDALIAELTDAEGHVRARSIDFADLERRVVFPEPSLQLQLTGDTVTVTSQTFARRVRLKAADETGDEFGFYFEDNHFDLPAGETRQLRVFGPGLDTPRPPAIVSATTAFGGECRVGAPQTPVPAG